MVCWISPINLTILGELVLMILTYVIFMMGGEELPVLQ